MYYDFLYNIVFLLFNFTYGGSLDRPDINGAPIKTVSWKSYIF